MPQANGKPDRGFVTIDPQECKGCGLCVNACTPGVLALASSLNHMGYHPAQYAGHGCTGCGLCFYACPEPGAIVVYKLAKTVSSPALAMV